MSVVECDHAPSENPRYAGCRKCGELLPDTEAQVRNEEYETAFLAAAAADSARRFGLAAEGFPLAVKRRLILGQERYGNTFIGKDLPHETLEEAWDAGAYAVLDAQKRLASDLEDSDAWHLFEIAVHAAAIDAHARQLGRD